MITHELGGGLGNQLYQIITTIALAIRTKQSFFFTYSETLGKPPNTIRVTYWNTLLKQLKKYTSNEININSTITYIREINHNYHAINCNYDDNLFILQGYFQSYKYFENEFQEISKMIGFEEQKNNLILDTRIANSKNSISMHFRLGDYKYKQEYHPLMSVNYYKQSLQYIINNNKDENRENDVFYFCEEEDVDTVVSIIEELKDLSCTFFRISNVSIPDWEQLLIMSLCKHNIIANSTFSLWGAYLNTNKDKIVCYPSLWFGNGIGHCDTNDMFPETWIKL
jgi:hypothetical protein